MAGAIGQASLGRDYKAILGQYFPNLQVESVYEQFVEKLIGKVQKLTVGNGLEKTTRLGPMHTKVRQPFAGKCPKCEMNLCPKAHG